MLYLPTFISKFGISLGIRIGGICGLCWLIPWLLLRVDQRSQQAAKLEKAEQNDLEDGKHKEIPKKARVPWNLLLRFSSFFYEKKLDGCGS